MTEYCTFFHPDPAQIIAQANKLAEEGWELITVSNAMAMTSQVQLQPIQVQVAYFKRPKVVERMAS